MRGLGLNKPRLSEITNNYRYKLTFKFNTVPKSCIANVSGVPRNTFLNYEFNIIKKVN